MSNELTRRQLLGTFGILAATPLVSGVAGGIAWPNVASSGTRRDEDDLTVLTEDPLNAEPDLAKLVEQQITPVELFYVRSHAPVPKIDPGQFRLHVTGLVDRELTLSLEQLETTFARVRVECTLTCAGNRRTEHIAVKSLSGVPWGPGAIGNANWSGFRLSDVLKAAGVMQQARHVCFEGLDEIALEDETIPFGGSIPLDKALSETTKPSDALLCDQMNGEALTPDHGAPLRTIVPGYIGARSVKWLGKIIVSDRPSPNHYMENAYKLLYENTAAEKAAAEPLLQYAINSFASLPTTEQLSEAKQHGADKLRLRGYALAQGEAEADIAKVEWSLDGGKNWTAAKFISPAKAFCWRLWEAEIPMADLPAELFVRATDSAGSAQPREVRWNAKGYQFNAWQKATLGEVYR